MKGKTKFKCIDGPLRGQTLWLQHDGKTLVFRIKQWVGRYVLNGPGSVRWESAA